MGKLARFACILTPMLLTIAALTCTILVMIGGTNKKNAWISDLSFFKIDTRYVQIPDSFDLTDSDWDDDIIKTGLKEKTNEELGLADFYTIHLWNYCYGDIEEENGKDSWKTKECSKPEAKFYFDIVEIFQIEAEENGGTGIPEEDLPDNVKKVRKAIKVVSNLMISLYIIGVAATGVTFFVGWFGLLSRWGSCVTTIFANISLAFLLLASATATGLFVVLREAFNRALDDFGAKASVNMQVLALTWVSVAFALGASIFWTLSTCCCSGRSNKVMGRDKHRSIGSEKAPYSYERVAAPYMPTNTAPAGQSSGGAYEPYRHAGSH